MYLFSYFKTVDEELFLAVSEDGFDWTECNGGKPVFRTELGNKSIRDPFILLDNDRQFHLLATNGWWNQSIIHAVSDNLIEWRNEEELPLMGQVADCKNMWAPEAIFDPQCGCYYIFWSSTVGRNKAKQHDNRIWFVKTADFRQFTAPAVLMDFGFNIIDATIHKYSDEYIIAAKDETQAVINVYSAPGIEGAYKLISTIRESGPIEGPTIYWVDDKQVMLYDFFNAEDCYGAASSSDGYEWQPVENFSLPFRARHGSVIQVPDAAVAQLLMRQ